MYRKVSGRSFINRSLEVFHVADVFLVSGGGENGSDLAQAVDVHRARAPDVRSEYAGEEKP
jgi:hypothetical protein